MMRKERREERDLFSTSVVSPLLPLPSPSPFSKIRISFRWYGDDERRRARGSLRARSGTGPSQVENSGGAAWRIDPFAWNHRALFSISLLGGEKIPGLEFFSGMEGARIRRRINGGRIYLGLDDGLWRWRPRSNVRCSPIGSRPVHLREAHASLFFKLYFHDFSCNGKRKSQIFNFLILIFFILEIDTLLISARINERKIEVDDRRKWNKKRIIRIIDDAGKLLAFRIAAKCLEGEGERSFGEKCGDDSNGIEARSFGS